MKIGILTFYYNSYNFGATLQAYALTKFLNDNGYDAEQICYSQNKKYVVNYADEFIDEEDENDFVNEEKVKNKTEFIPISLYIHKCKKRLANKLSKKIDDYNIGKVVRKINIKKKKTDKFLLSIPHSSVVYSAENITTADNYDAYICGSDQVWHMKWLLPNYFLDFVPIEKKKIAYAVSSGGCDISSKGKEFIENQLKTFQLVTVREEDLKNQINNIMKEKIADVVIDPVFLLSRNDWKKMTKKNYFKKKYVFCYFLGNANPYKSIINEFAKEKGFVVINIMTNEPDNSHIDYQFGDVKIADADPIDFISYIQHAECVFTDSFHAIAFSIIFEKSYFVFSRVGDEKMNTRIVNITNLIGDNAHYCDKPHQLNSNYIRKHFDKDYSFNSKKLTDLIDFSKESLLTTLEN